MKCVICGNEEFHKFLLIGVDMILDSKGPLTEIKPDLYICKKCGVMQADPNNIKLDSSYHGLFGNYGMGDNDNEK